MVKKVAVSGAVVALLLGLLFGRDAVSYVTSSLGWVRDGVRDAIPVEFELSRAKRMIKDLDPEIKRAMTVIATEEIEVAGLQKQIGDLEGQVAKSKSEILRLQSDLQRGDSNYVYAGRQYTSKQVETDLTQRFDRHKSKEQTVDKLRQICTARDRGLTAAREKLKALQSARGQLEVDVANLEARFELVKVAQTTAPVNFDDSQLSRTKDLLKSIGTRIEVAEKLVTAETVYPGEIALEDSATRDIRSEITQHFNGSSENQGFVKLD